MSQAARLGDPIGHSPSLNWLLAGLLAGAAVAVAGVAIVGTGGLAAAALVGGAAALGGGLGETLSTMSWAPKDVCGKISGTCSSNVFINRQPAARAHADLTKCNKHTGPPRAIGMGSATVFINGLPAARLGDKIVCGAVITGGSNNVNIGGGSVQTDAISPENLVPGWVQRALLIVGVGSAVVLGGWMFALGGLAAGTAGGYAGNWLGGKAFKQGSDGQKWSMLIGSLLGGLLGAKGAGFFAKEAEPGYTIFAGHGQSDGTTSVVPENSWITFYSEDGAAISNRLGNVIETGGDLSGVYSRTYGPGKEVPNYILHPPDGLTIKGNPITVTKPTSLDELLKPNMGHCQWAACTSDPNSPNANKVFGTTGIMDSQTGEMLAPYAQEAVPKTSQPGDWVIIYSHKDNPDDT